VGGTETAVGTSVATTGASVTTGACVVAVAHADITMAAIINTVSKLQYFLIIFSPHSLIVIF
jgi:hypothetical protein